MKTASKSHFCSFFVSQSLFELPIPLKEGFALLDEEHKSLFMTWLGEHGSSVMKVARAYTLTSEECQDLAQEILLQAWRSLPKFEGKASPATWFYRVALHTAMNSHRKDKPRRFDACGWKVESSDANLDQR
jgi:RNA polymerase sigma factor (sigma-70 family)